MYARGLHADSTPRGERPQENHRNAAEPPPDFACLGIDGKLGNDGPMNYIPHYTKKKQQLARREAALQRLLSSDASITKLLAAAGEVRAARIRVLRAQRATLVPTDHNKEQFERLDVRISQAEKLTAAEVLHQYSPASGEA